MESIDEYSDESKIREGLTSGHSRTRRSRNRKPTVVFNTVEDGFQMQSGEMTNVNSGQKALIKLRALE